LKEYTIIIEQDEAGFYVGDVAELPGCHTQARDIDTLKSRLREAIELWLEEYGQAGPFNTFVKVEKMAV